MCEARREGTLRQRSAKRLARDALALGMGHLTYTLDNCKWKIVRQERLLEELSQLVVATAKFWVAWFARNLFESVERGFRDYPVATGFSAGKSPLPTVSSDEAAIEPKILGGFVRREQVGDVGCDGHAPMVHLDGQFGNKKTPVLLGARAFELIRHATPPPSATHFV